MLFMVIEHFPAGMAAEIYRTVRERGRMVPEGLTYVDSWVSANLATCYQLMECDDPLLLQEWIARWRGMIEMEFVPVTRSKDTAVLMARLAAEETGS